MSQVVKHPDPSGAGSRRVRSVAPPASRPGRLLHDQHLCCDYFAGLLLVFWAPWRQEGPPLRGTRTEHQPLTHTSKQSLSTSGSRERGKGIRPLGDGGGMYKNTYPSYLGAFSSSWVE